MTWTWLISALVGALCLGIGYAVRVAIAKRALSTAEDTAKAVVKQAREEAESLRKEAKLQAKGEAIKARDDFEKSTAAKREELAGLEERALQREANLDRKVAMIEKKERAVEQRAADLEKMAKDTEATKAELDRLVKEEMEKLQRVAGMTQDEAK